MHSFGESTEMYLKTICELSTPDSLVPISTLADRLGISPVSATEMVHRMQENNLLEHERYKGVRLTNNGAQRALRVIRRHRLWERFLADELHLPWEKVHDLACRLEHATDQDLVNALDDYLHRPTSCPHGNPIPNPEGRLDNQSGVQLDTLTHGVRCIVLRIRPESQAVLHYLANRGIKPGTILEIIAFNEFDRLWTVCVDDHEEHLGRPIASRLVVQPMEKPLNE